MSKKERASASVFGGPTVLTVLLILLFALFSMLALSRAQTARTLAGRTADTAQAYYEAAGKAETVLAALDGAAAQAPASCGTLAVAAAEEQGAADASFDGSEFSARFQAGAQGSYVLRIRLQAEPNGETAYTVLSGHIVPDDPADTDTTLPVYQ